MGSVPLMYQGSKYKPGVLVSIPRLPSDSLKEDAALSVKYSNGQWIDPTGNHVWTVVDSPTVTSGPYGNMLTLDGISQYLTTPADTPDLTPGNNDFTIVAVVKVTSFHPLPQRAVFILIKDNPNGDDEIMLGINSANFSPSHSFFFSTNGQNAFPEVDSVISAQLNTLYLIIAWYDSSTQSLYMQIDNGAVDSVACPNPNVTTDPPHTLDIGTDSGAGMGPPVSFFGLQTIVYFYNRKLTQAEKDYIWNNGAGQVIFP